MEDQQPQQEYQREGEESPLVQALRNIKSSLELLRFDQDDIEEVLSLVTSKYETNSDFETIITSIDMELNPLGNENTDMVSPRDGESHNPVIRVVQKEEELMEEMAPQVSVTPNVPRVNLPIKESPSLCVVRGKTPFPKLRLIISL